MYEEFFELVKCFSNFLYNLIPGTLGATFLGFLPMLIYYTTIIVVAAVGTSRYVENKSKKKVNSVALVIAKLIFVVDGLFYTLSIYKLGGEKYPAGIIAIEMVLAVIAFIIIIIGSKGHVGISILLWLDSYCVGLGLSLVINFCIALHKWVPNLTWVSVIAIIIAISATVDAIRR